MQRYLSREGDSVDEICWRHYGHSQQTTEIVLAANRDLARYGPLLPAGVKILLPDIPPTQQTTLVRIWD
jgi:phage tail protein X